MARGGLGRICRQQRPLRSTPAHTPVHTLATQDKRRQVWVGDHIYCIEVTGQVIHWSPPGGVAGTGLGWWGESPRWGAQGGQAPLPIFGGHWGLGMWTSPAWAPEQGTKPHKGPAPQRRATEPQAAPDRGAGGRHCRGRLHAFLRFWGRRKTRLESWGQPGTVVFVCGPGCLGG